MNINNCLKILILFFIFYTGNCDKNHHSTIPLFNNNICKNLKDNNYVPFKKRLLHYGCKRRGVSRIRRAYNPYAVFATDILRKYIYIVNVIVIYIILYSL
jgi:hypothetical protein